MTVICIEESLYKGLYADLCVKICKFVIMYYFVSRFREGKFCGVPFCVFGKAGCTVCKKMLQNTYTKYNLKLFMPRVVI
jgi:hypothetical protein